VKTITGRLFSFGAIAFAVLHLAESWFHFPWMLDGLSIFGLIILLCFFILTSSRRALLPLILTAAAVLVLWRSTGGDGFAGHLFEGFRYTRLLLPVLLVFPMFSWVLKLEPYVESIMVWAGRRLRNGRRMHFVLFAVTQFISSFLMIGAIHFMYRWMHTLLEKKTAPEWEEFKGTIALRGFALATLWVITIPSLSYVVSVFHANVAVMMAQGLAFALIGVWLTILIQGRRDRKTGTRLSEELFAQLRANESKAAEQRTGANVREFLLIFLVLMAVIFAMHGLTGLPLLYLVPVILFPGVALIFIAKRKGKQFAGELKAYLFRELPFRSYEMGFFVATGLFIHAMNTSGWSEAIVTTIHNATDHAQLINMPLLLPWIIVGLSFMGLTPLTNMVLLGGLIQSIHLPYPPELIAFSMAVGSMMGHILSPITVAAIVLSAANGKSPWFNSVRSNWAFALIFYAVSQLYVQTMLLTG